VTRQSTPEVRTPSGSRPPDFVHRVGPGDEIDRSGDLPVIVDAATRTVRVQARGRFSPRRLAGDGWVTWASWVNDTGAPIVSLATSWSVPAAPSTDSGQTVFLFDALVDAAAQNIVQPVVWWGPAAVGGGSYWSAASWVVDASGHVFHSDAVRVSTGRRLTGAITVELGRAAPRCTCVFVELPETRLAVNAEPDLVMATETLEAYGVGRDTDNPAADRSEMGAIALETGGAFDEIPWSVTDRVKDFGQHTVVVSRAAREGEVALCYRAARREGK
jgi:hypothetical protein